MDRRSVLWHRRAQGAFACVQSRGACRVWGCDYTQTVNDAIKRNV